MKAKRIAAAALAAALLGCGGIPVFGQSGSGPLREIQIHLSIGAAAPGTVGILSFRPDFFRAEARQQRTLRGKLPRQRLPELSEDFLVIVSVNGRGEEIFRTVLLDPRLLRAETADDAGRLTSTSLYRDNVDFWITVPDDQGLDKLLFFHPRWTGETFLLVPAGEARLR
jgi:hypothetical protein